MTEKEAKYIKRYYCKRCRTSNPKLAVVYKSKYKDDKEHHRSTDDREREKRREEKKRKREERHKKEAEAEAKGTYRELILSVDIFQLPFYRFLTLIILLSFLLSFALFPCLVKSFFLNHGSCNFCKYR